jgi:hypothetical protein
MTTATNWSVVLQTSEVLREEQRQEVGTEVSISPGLFNECSQKHRFQLRNRRHEAEYSKIASGPVGYASPQNYCITLVLFYDPGLH